MMEWFEDSWGMKYFVLWCFGNNGKIMGFLGMIMFLS